MADDPSSFAPDLWTPLEGMTCARRYEPQAVLFEQGQPARGIYMIRTGEVRIWMPERILQTRLVTPVTSGTLLGLSEAISGGAHKVSAVALVQTDVGFVPRDGLIDFLREHQDVCLEVVKILSEDLHGLYHTFHQLNVAHPRGRRWLLDGGVQ